VDTHIATANKTILLVIKFRIRGSLRFLSHAEMLKVFQRACIRAGLQVQHSQGFNPRPKLSLPLPRSVGVETDDDLLCLGVHVPEASYVLCHAKTTSSEAKRVSEPENTPNAQYAIRNTIMASLSEQLPAGCELISVCLAGPKMSFQPCSATYVLPIQQEYDDDKLTARIGRLLASDSLCVTRDSGAMSRGTRHSIKNVDVRPFLKSIELHDKDVVVECVITSAGSIRVDEILNLLELDAENLTGPVRRTNIEWKNN
jgi:hypothetical protein